MENTKLSENSELLSESSNFDAQFTSRFQNPTVSRIATDKCVKRCRSRHVVFKNVEIFYFDRLQGHVCVPTQGGSTLGMASTHSSHEELTVSDHQRIRLAERYSSLLKKFENGKLDLTNDQFSYLTRRLNALLNSLRQFPSREVPHSANFALNGDDITDANYNSRPGYSDVQCAHISAEIPEELSFPLGIYDENLETQLCGLMECYFLQVLSVKKRRLLLRKAGLKSIDHGERIECQAIRMSREVCGCSCPAGVCLPDSCFCARNGIKCQVDRPFFPCSCVQPSQCENPEGRVEFDSIRVRTHYLHTRMRLDKEQTIHSLATGTWIAENHSMEEPMLKRARVDSSINASDFPTSSREFGALQQSPLSSLPDNSSSAFENEVLAMHNTTAFGACLDCQNEDYVQFLAQQLTASNSEDGSDDVLGENVEFGLPQTSDEFLQTSSNVWVHNMSSVVETFCDYQLPSLETNSLEVGTLVNTGHSALDSDTVDNSEENQGTDSVVQNLDDTSSPSVVSSSIVPDALTSCKHSGQTSSPKATTGCSPSSDVNATYERQSLFALDPISSLISRFSSPEPVTSRSFSNAYSPLASSDDCVFCPCPSTFSHETSDLPVSVSSSYSVSPENVSSGNTSRATSPIVESVTA